MFQFRPVLWNRSDVESIVGGMPIAKGNEAWQATGVCRRPAIMQPGDLWIATEDNPSLLAMTPNMLNKGAVAAIVSGFVDVPCWSHVIKVPNTKTALQKLAEFARQRTQALVVAVTGSVGKTGVKDALAHVLSEQAPVYSNYRNANCGWGLPESLAQIPSQADYAILEMGMLNRQSIATKSKRVRPHIGLITEVAAAHLVHHGSVESIAQTKADIVAGMQPGGTLILPRDNQFYPLLRSRGEACGHVKRILTFGSHTASDVRLVDAVHKCTCSHVHAEILGNKVRYRLSLPGKHWVSNSLAVLTAVAAIGADLNQACRSLDGLQPSFRRGERFRVELNDQILELIDDTWNANPTSNRAAFDVVKRIDPCAGGRRIAILGDMLELGEESKSAHAGLSLPLQEAKFDLVHTVGNEMEYLHEQLPRRIRGIHCENARLMAREIAGLVEHGDVLLVKGSNSIEMWRIVHQLVPNRRAALPASSKWTIQNELN